VATVVAVDAGTTGVRSMAVSDDGRVGPVAYREITQHYPRPAWVEHDPGEILAAVDATLHAVLGQLDGPVAAIGITNQRETAVAWDRRTGAARHRAIVWQDRRTADRCAELEVAGHLPAVRERTGLVLDPYFSATKFEWLLSDGGVAADDDLALGTVDAWVLWHLTAGAVHATDPSNASRTLLFDIRRRVWDEELADLFGVPLRALPAVLPSSGRFGSTAGTGAVPAGIPISGVAGDQQAALFGQACFRPGMTKNTYGTGSFVLMNVGSECPPPVDGMLTSVAWELGDGPVAYALEGAIFVTGAAVQWLRDELGLVASAAEIEPLAATVGDTNGAVLVPAFTGLGSPYWDPRARGALLGLTRGTTRAHVARAAIASMVMQTCDVVEAMTTSSGRPIIELRVDGGASVMDLLLRMQADRLGVRVARSAVLETTALGAAHLAGLAEGVWGDLDSLAATWRLDASFEPAGDPAVNERERGEWRRAVERSRAWATDR
jgi:glycerol kinase